jgi:hypothetical protein
MAMNARRRLERELVVVLGQLRALDAGPDAPASREPLLARVERLHDALDRVEVGSYGTCLDCTVPIEKERLKAQPEAETCAACEEREAADSRRRVA